MKQTWLAVVLIALFAALAVENAQAIMSRGVYVNGQVHFIGLGVKNNNNVLFHQAFSSVTPTSPISYTLSPTGTTQISPACNPDPGLRSPMNGAVFNNKIYFVYTGYPQAAGKAGSCNYSSGTNLYVTYWDLTTNSWAADVDAENHPLFPMKLGPVHHNNTLKNGKPNDLAGAAIVVFNPDPNNATNPTTSQLYVFGDSGTYTSADGINWAFNSGPNNNEQFSPTLAPDGQPLDAATYYPPDANPRIMLILGLASDGQYDFVYGGNWNGLFGSDSDFTSQDAVQNNPSYLNAGVVLLPGTATSSDPGFPGGNTGPSLQLFGVGNNAPSFPQNTIFRSEYSYTNAGGGWQSGEYLNYTTTGLDFLIAFPWFTTECTTSNNIQRQNFEINYFNYSNGKTSNPRALSFISDAMVPQNTDISLNCGSWGGTVTNTAAGSSDAQATLRKYWTLAGVVMGSPPFAINDVQDYDIPELSNVNYGQSQTSEVTNTQSSDNTVLFSAGASVRGGIKDVFGVEGEFDNNYKHAWESENKKTQTSTVAYGFELGTSSANTEDISHLGMYGWAIFHTPNIVVQDYAIYAYDYNVNTNSGTYIGQDVHSVQIDAQNLSYTTAAFELANPGGNNDTYPGLMSGIVPLAMSTDLANPVWQQNWESNANDSASTHYVTKVGTGEKGEAQLNMLTFTNSGSKALFSNEIQNITTSGQTSDVDVTAGATLNIGTEVKGFKVGLKAGYAGVFSNSVETSTTLGKDVEADLNMKACSTRDCVKILEVQPHLLTATDGSAPWIPAAYSGSRPWAMAWTITSYQTVGGQTYGTSPAAANLSGIVTGSAVNAAGLSAAPMSRYRVKGGRLEWVRRGRRVKPIPMAAGKFEPALGVTVRLNGYTWSSTTARGRWSRKGKVWTFRTKDSVQRDRVSMKLDFGKHTWDFSLSRADLSTAMGTSDGRAHLALNVNGKYEFYFDVKHKISTSWKERQASGDPEQLSLTHYSGSCPSKGPATVLLKGRLPATLDHFGDVSIIVNGHQYDVPVISQRRYRHAIAAGETLIIKKGEARLSLDFGNKTWRFQAEGRAARRLAPLAARAAIQFKVGGRRWYSGEHTIGNYTSRLSIAQQRPQTI